MSLPPIRMHIPLVDLQAQYASIRDEIDSAIGEVIHSGQFIGGEKVMRFAEDFAGSCDARYCVPCANGTDALEIALSSMGFGPGDEVIIPAFSFVATLEAVVNIGATPVLCDIDPERYTMDVDQAIALVNDRTRVILPVHLYGQMADMNRLMAYASDHHLFVIEDAAQAHGASCLGQKAGSVGDINTFSFYPGKNLGAYGDAGAITTQSEWLYTKCLKIANHGRIDKYDHELIGRNSRMDSLQAAILSVKLRHLSRWVEQRRVLADRYRMRLREVEQVVLPGTFPDCPSAYHLFVIRVPSAKRSGFRNSLREEGIETGIHYPIALTQLKATTEQLGIRASCPEAERAAQEVVSLPIYPEMTDTQQEYICEKIIGYFR